MQRRDRRRRKRRKTKHGHHDELHLIAAGRVRVLAQRTAELLMQAVVVPGDETKEGTLIEAVAVPWFELIKLMSADPQFMFRIDWRKWEELLAGAYQRAGFDEVILTPRSGDLGRDVIASKRGVGCVRILDQMKRYKPGHLVTAEEVRAMLGVVSADRKASKGIITTTSTFAPGVAEDELLQPFMPYRLELKSGPELLKWLEELARRKEE
jgi:restriction system protein